MRHRIGQSRPQLRPTVWLAFLATCVVAFGARAEEGGEDGPRTAAGLPAEGELDAFLGEPRFDVQPVFSGERFPNVVVGTDGTVVATWGRNRYVIRRSEDGGQTWGPEIVVAEPGFHGGGAVVDETSGDILVFVEAGHPPAPLTVYRSRDQGRTWSEQEVVIHPDEHDQTPSMHMNEVGITLRHGPHAGRLLRPSRCYTGGTGRPNWPNHYTNAIYSDDGGRTWHTSSPFPAKGTGEATVAELSDGRIYYNSRRHWAPDGETARWRHIAHSDDGGQTWKDLSVSDVLPDGSQHRDYGLMGGLVRLPVAGHDVLVFSNIVSDGGRRNGHVWASFDGGQTWPVKRVVDEGSFAYSSLSAGRPGTPSEGWIYLLYEGSGGARIARFNLTWLVGGARDAAQRALKQSAVLQQHAEIGDQPGQYAAEALERLQQAAAVVEQRLADTDGLALVDRLPESDAAEMRDLEQALEALEAATGDFEDSVVLPETLTELAWPEMPWLFRTVGSAWERRDKALQNQGVGNYLVTRYALQEGDFHIRARLALEPLDGTAATFVFGVGAEDPTDGIQHFGFDGRGHMLFVEGGVFGSTRRVGTAADHIESDVPFVFEAVRRGDMLTISLNGEAVYEQEIGSGRIGPVGLRPWRSTLRLYELHVTGSCELVR